MSYKTILVHADLSRHAPDRIRLAAAIARAEGAQLVGAAMTGVSRYVYAQRGMDLHQSVAAGFVDSLHEHARDALAQFERLATEAGVPYATQLVRDDPEGGLVQLARFADLVVVSQTDPDEPVAGVVRDLPEFVMLNAARPVLMVPFAGQFDRVAGPALVAWDGSREAARALSGALPLLRTAGSVSIVQFDQGQGIAPAADTTHLLPWLAAHGVHASVQQSRIQIDVGPALLSLAADVQAGLIVMGGYGHTRFRELVVGGVTRCVLDAMTAPVLMAH